MNGSHHREHNDCEEERWLESTRHQSPYGRRDDLRDSLYGSRHECYYSGRSNADRYHRRDSEYSVYPDARYTRREYEDDERSDYHYDRYARRLYDDEPEDYKEKSYHRDY